MRKSSALVCLALIVGISLALAMHDNPATGQDAEPARPVSSLEFGKPFDRDARLAFEQQLQADEHVRLIRLNSRFALADASLPLPVDDPQRPFYLKLRGDMTRALADQLAAAGVSFIGYANPHTHILRAADAGSLAAVHEMIDGHPLVVGTLLQRPEDVMNASMYQRSQGTLAGAFRVLFWRDVEIPVAGALLDSAEATIIEGRIEGASPLVTVTAPDEGVRLLLASEWVEQVAPASVKITTNQTSAAMSNADPATIDVSPYNLDGDGQVAGVWDAGVARMSHEQYQGLSGVTAPAGWPGSSRVYNVNTGANMHYHAAHVTGTIVGDGSNNASAQGYAPSAVALVHLWKNVDEERREARHSFNHVADNHSYASFDGNSADWGEYDSDTQRVDITNRDILLCQVQSAGNYATGLGSASGSAGNKPFGNSNPTCSVPTFNAHRNGFIIAAAQDNEDIASFSSRGPAMDGRLVPQFCANGVSLESTDDDSDSDYRTLSGTSMSGPSVCGSVVLLSQLWRREHNDQMFTPDVARAVLAQTCRDKYHTGPDYHFGFGIVDCQAAADLILADKAGGGDRIFRGTARSGSVSTYTFDVTTSDPIHMVLSWLDVWASTSASTTLVNDLDIELRDPSNTAYYPYSGVTTATSGDHSHTFTTTGPNRRDNIELVHVDNPMTGTWTLRVIAHSVPANPQSGVPNDATGFVVASSHSVNLSKLVVEDSVNGAAPVNIPDNNTGGITRNFTVNDSRIAVGIRLHTRIYHERRGDLAITLTSPNSTTIQLKTTNNGVLNSEMDLLAVFPDTKQSDDDVAAALYEYVQGTWTVNIRDTVNGNTGTLNYLALEFDLRTNAAPVANAGGNFTVRENAGGSLNASGSSDPDGDPVAYQWAQTGGVSVNLSNTTAEQPTFTAPSVSQDEVVTFQVTARDLSGLTDTDSVQFTILNNQAPVADAGADFDARELQSGQLDASGSSDPESDPLTYAWVQTGGAITLSLSSATAQQPTFNVPALAQDEVVTFQVTVTDDRNDSDTDTVQVTLRNNLAPLADAGADFGVLESANGQLDGGGTSDPESDTITYAWVQTGGGVTLSLSTNSVAQPTFTAPTVTQNEVLTFELTATDTYGDFTTDTVQVTIELNVAPVAEAGANIGAIWGATVQLDGTGSFDPNGGDAISYSWVQISGTATVSLSSSTSSQPTFTAPGVDDTLQFELTVTDSRGLTDSDIVTVYVNETGALPKSSSGGGGKGGGGCSTSEHSSLWLLALLLGLVTAVRWRRQME